MSTTNLTIEIHTHPQLNQLETLPSHANIRIRYHNTNQPMNIPVHASRRALEQAEDYDMVGFMEDDIGVLDRDFFEKIELLVESSQEHYAFIPHRCETIPGKGDVILSGDPDGGRPDLYWDTGEQIKFSWVFYFFRGATEIQVNIASNLRISAAASNLVFGFWLPKRPK